MRKLAIAAILALAAGCGDGEEELTTCVELPVKRQTADTCSGGWKCPKKTLYWGTGSGTLMCPGPDGTIRGGQMPPDPGVCVASDATRAALVTQACGLYLP